MIMGKLLFFSCEALHRAVDPLMAIAYPAEKKFNELYAKKYSNEKLKSIAIIFICTNQDMLAREFYHERRYISWKNNYADIRLQIPYEQFCHSDKETQKQMVWDVIKKAIDYIRQRKAFFQIDEFENDLKICYWNI